MSKLVITPKTKIYDLLEAYPELEDTLIKMAPQFKKLKNPVLRKTITKITNLSQAASIAGLNVETIVTTLRKEVGQSAESFETEDVHYITSQPSWFNEESVVNTIDISEMLNKGEQPVHEVLAAIKQLREGQILKIIAPFIPAPLIDKTRSLNYDHWLDRQEGEEYWVYFLGSSKLEAERRGRS